MSKELWQLGEFPFFELGEDGFPRPGKVSSYYRSEMKKRQPTCTQEHLAKQLGVTKQWVWEIENRDRGFDSISLRRELARQFAIPLILLGLASLEDEPNLGQLIKRHRQSMTGPLRTQAGLAKALGITEKAVREMENYNKGLDSLARRRVLATLLALPPAAIGIVTLEELIRQRQLAAVQESTTRLDLAEFKAALKRLWDQNHKTTSQNRLTEVETRLSRLHAELVHSSEQETFVRDMLTRYMALHAHLIRDQGRYNEAIAELHVAVLQAQQANNTNLLATTLLRLGATYHERGDIALAQSKIDSALGDSASANKKREQANADFTAATGQLTRARQLERLLPGVRVALLLADGGAQARLAYGNTSAMLAALSLFKQAGKIIKEENGQFEDDEFELFANSAERRYQSRKAAALLAVGWPREALDALTDLMALPSQDEMTRMNNYMTYLWAQAYADLGTIDAAATLAQETLKAMKQIKSNLNIARIAGLHGQLNLKDNKQIEVIRLGVMLHE